VQCCEIAGSELQPYVWVVDFIIFSVSDATSSRKSPSKRRPTSDILYAGQLYSPKAARPSAMPRVFAR
jgi:hypothetical protein